MESIVIYSDIPYHSSIIPNTDFKIHEIVSGDLAGLLMKQMDTNNL